MSVLQHYFDAVQAQTGQKSSNGSVLSKFFEPATEAAKVTLEVKQIGDDLGVAIAEIFKSFERENNVKFRFTRKQGRAK